MDEVKLVVLSGVDSIGRVHVQFTDNREIGSHHYQDACYKVKHNKRGAYITIGGVRYFITIPEGVWAVHHLGYTVWVPQNEIETFDWTDYRRRG